MYKNKNKVYGYKPKKVVEVHEIANFSKTFLKQSKIVI